MMNRRAFLKSSGLAVLTIGTGPTFLERAAAAAASTTAGSRPKVLVTIFQRGAMDGLMAVTPVADPRLSVLRPRLAMQAGRSGELLDLGIDFALHPSFGDLLPLWKENHLAIVHNVGSPHPTRSHFDAQDYMESGTPGRKGTADGWLNRVVGELGHDATPFRAVSMTPALPRSLYGDHPALAVTNLRSFNISSLPGTRGSESAGEGFEALYEQTSEQLLRQTASETFEAVDMLDKLDVKKYRPSRDARYPNGALSTSLQQIAFLIKSQVGLEVAFAESSGWDTHVQQGTSNGSFSRRARDLSASIAAFWRDLGQYRDDVVVMTMTEFGRTVAENGSGGTDHGHGSCLFVLGGNVDGGKVHGTFEGLDHDLLFEGRDLPVTTDFRDVFAEVAGGHLALDPKVQLFPDWVSSRIPLVRRT